MLTLHPINTTPSILMDRLHRHSIIKQLLLLVSKVPQPVPLTGHLRVEGPDVVIDTSRRLGEEVLMEEFTVEKARVRVFLGVKGPV